MQAVRQEKKPPSQPEALEPIRTLQSPITSWISLAGQVNPEHSVVQPPLLLLVGVSCIFTTKARTVG
jgi:hypothetical protein